MTASFQKKTLLLGRLGLGLFRPRAGLGACRPYLVFVGRQHDALATALTRWAVQSLALEPPT